MDTSAARAAIFKRIRQAQSRPEQPAAAELEQVRQDLAHHGSGPRPDLGPDLVARFRQQAERTSQTLG